MHIELLRIRNFRKLDVVEVDLDLAVTLLVGANNSGKSSAMECVKRFIDGDSFELADLPIHHLDSLNAIGRKWLSERAGKEPAVRDTKPWSDILPALDIWLHASNTEAADVQELLPLLDEFTGAVGARYRLFPRDEDDLRLAFIAATDAAQAMGARAGDLSVEVETPFWPVTFADYLQKHFSKHFQVQRFALDPGHGKEADGTPARPPRDSEIIPDSAVPLKENPLDSLLVVDYVDAQRFGVESGREPATLSQLMDNFYRSFLHDTETLRDEDIEAIAASLAAQTAFDKVLGAAFSSSLDEIRTVGYPGVGNPELVIRTAVELGNTLSHKSVLKYAPTGTAGQHGELPEHLNGLGYRNLVLMMFRLMSFRLRRHDTSRTIDGYAPPLHLVLLEEPEAHLHPQVQQVFVRHAHKALKSDEHGKSAQLLVSTHSSHLTHEVSLRSIRYFQRPTSQKQVATVVSLATTFGSDDATKRFAERYLKLHHSNALFADAMILVEGNAERILLPLLIEKHFKDLASSYIEIVEVGGAHAHRLRELVEVLGIPTLVITDIDAMDPSNANKQCAPVRGAGFRTANHSIKSWLGAPAQLDDLFTFKSSIYGHSGQESDVKHDVFFAHQRPQDYEWNERSVEAVASTFEDALAFENLNLFRKGNHEGFANKLHKRLKNESTTEMPVFAASVFEDLKTVNKSEFAIDILLSADTITTPGYIADGLHWLQAKLHDAPMVKSASKGTTP